jgi:predicted Rossmann-fold nucleotide-binding protein
MKSLADEFLLHSNSIKLIMTKTSRQYAQLQHKLIDTESIIWVDSIRDQLETFERLASSVIVLPGGYGTFLELFYFLTNKKNSLLNNNKIYLFNCDGFFNHLLMQLEVMHKEKIIKQKEKDILIVLNSIDDLICHFK